MAKKWGEVAASDGFKALSPDEQDGARRQYFDEVVSPQVPPEHHTMAWEQFSADAGAMAQTQPTPDYSNDYDIGSVTDPMTGAQIGGNVVNRALVVPTSKPEQKYVGNAGRGNGAIQLVSEVQRKSGRVDLPYEAQTSEQPIFDPATGVQIGMGQAPIAGARSNQEIDKLNEIERKADKLSLVNPGVDRERLVSLAKSGMGDAAPAAVDEGADVRYMRKGYSPENARANAAFDQGTQAKLNRTVSSAAPDPVTGERGAVGYDPTMESERTRALEKELKEARENAKLHQLSQEDGPLASGLAKGFGQSVALGKAAIGYMGAMAGDDEVKKWGIDGYNDTMRKVGAITLAKEFSDIENPGQAATWFAETMSYGAYQAAEALITGGLGSAAGKTIGKQAAMQIATLAASNVSKEIGSIYAEAVEEAKRTGNPEPSLSKVAAAAIAAASIDTFADKMGIDTLTKNGFKGNFVARLAKSMPLQLTVQGGTEAAQKIPEEWGAGKDPFRAGIAKEYANEFAAGTVMGAGPGVMGAVNKPNAAAREARIKAMQDSGETAIADFLQKANDKQTTIETVDAEIAKLPGNEDFAQQYREARIGGLKPAESAARSAITVTYKGLLQGTGIPEQAITVALDKARDMPLDKVPDFLHKFTSGLAKRGLIQSGDDIAQVGQHLEAARDDAMEAAIGAMYTPIKPVMDDVLALESEEIKPLASADTAQQATESIASLPPSAHIDMAAHDAATSPLNNLPEPTQAQKEAGNYKVGRVNLHGLNISVENPEGSVRSGTSPDGTKWENTLAAHYGYIRGTEGNDGDHVDTFIGPNPNSQKVFVVDQLNKDGSFDEHKVMLGTDSLQQADDLYHANYHTGWTGRGAITEMSMADFKAWVRDGVKNQPVGSLKNSEKSTAHPVAESQAPAVSDSGDSGVATTQDASAPIHLGRDNVPLTEGGKAFKTRKAADDARKLNPGMRVVRADGGYALTEKTPAQLAAQEAAAKRLRQPRTSPSGELIPAHAMIASEGGLHPNTRADMGMQGNVTVGNRKLFAGEGRGLTIERATEKLVEQGYLPEGASHDQARALIKRSLTNPQYTPEGTEQMAAAELEARRVAAIAEIEEASDNQFFEIDDADIPWGADVSNTSTEAAMRALGFTDQEISDAIANESRVQGQDSPDSGGPDEGAATPAQADMGRRKSPEGEDPGGRSEARREEPRVEPPQTPAPAGVSVSDFESSLRPDGTLAVKGDPAAILEALKDFPRRSLTPMRGGILVGRTQAAKAMAILQPSEMQAPTRAEVVEQQDRAEQAAKDKEAADRKADKQAREEEDRKRIAKASEAAADSFELGGDAMANLTGQQDIFAEEQVAKREPTKIEDAGEKIGGARKDRWNDRGLDLSDLDGMSESEGAELATKANVWKPDYETMAESTEPVTAAMVKTVYDQLAAQPKTNTPAGRRNYVTMLQAVRKVYSEAKSPEEVKQAGEKVKRAIGLYTADPDEKKRARDVLFSVYKGRSDPFVLGYNELSKAKKMVEDGFPAKGEPWKKRLTVRAYSGTGFTPRGVEIMLDESAELGTPLTKEQVVAGFYRINAKNGKAVGYAPTKADAEAAAKTIYERDLKKGAAEKAEPSRPNLDALKRENLPKRTDRDVSADDFVKDFGFRGVEFGNWAAQDERQRIVNMAYDGLMDLAEIMGVPPKALSLNGTMGMAFGARGGGKFAAHYEPGKLVINMTKINGGGSMAHEWAHALDHYFGELNQKDAYTTKARGASGWYDEQQYKGMPITRMEKDAQGKWANVTKLRLDNLRPEMAKAFDGVMSALFSGQETKAQMVRSEELSIERYQALADKETDADTKAMYLRGIESRKQALEELRKDPEDKTYPKGRSSYAGEAQKLVGKSATGYWTRPTEMFARAFESWVFDKVTAMGAKSDYLVHGVEEDRFAGGGYKGNPYPTGQERATINAAFDKLASTIKTSETDKGVAMYARGALDEAFRRTIAPRSFMPIAEVQKAIDQLTAKWKDGPTVKVVRTPADLPIDSPADVRGLIHNGVAYIVATNHSDRQAVAKTLGHEVIGHYGLWKMLGTDGTRQFQRQLQLALKSGNVPLNKIAEKVRSLYRGGDGEFNLSLAQEANEIAAFAVESAIDADGNFKPGYGFFKEVWAKVAQFLRDIGIDMKFTNSELQGMLVSAMRGLETGKRLDGGGESLVAAALGDTPDAALKGFSKFDDLFALPLSKAKDLAQIARDNGEEVKVRTNSLSNRKMHILTFEDGTEVKIYDRPHDQSLEGRQIYGMELENASGRMASIGRPGENPEDVSPTDDVWIDVSENKPGTYGAITYNIAATYALNNDKIFIGDPASLSDQGLRRRTEQMLSHALKAGTTRHLAPHPRQVAGDSELGVPPLKWIYGDHVGNVERLIDVSLESLENGAPGAKDDTRYNPDTGEFTDKSGQVVPRKSTMGRGMAAYRAGIDKAQAGWRTLARAAFLRSFLGPNGRAEGSGILDRAGGNAPRIASRGTGEGNYPATERIFYARGGQGNGTGVTPGLFAPTVWNTPDPTRLDKFIYNMQDGRIDLKRVQQAIIKSGQDILEKWDARLAETLYPGRVAYRSQQFLDTEVKGLLESMAHNNLGMTELSDYLHARGAEERNKQVAKVNPEMPDGGAGKNSKGVLMTNDAARDYLAAVSLARKQVLDAMAKRVDAMTEGTRKLLVDEGLEKQETIDAWTSTYKNYVPMFRDEAESGAPHPQGSGFSVKGSASKRATGSTKEVTNILAHVLMQREAAITRAEKNRVALSLYGMALSHPNPEFWTTIKPSMAPASIAAELVNMGVDPATAQMGMEGVPTITTVDPNTGKKVDRPNPMYKTLPGAIPLKVNGEDRVLMVNSATERGARLAENLKNLDGLTKLDLANSLVGKSTRWLASVNTQYNPAFGIVNATRDTLEAAINLSSTPLAGKQHKLAAAMPFAMRGIYKALRGDLSGDWAKLYEQFQADGAQTGFKEMFRDATERTKAIEKMLSKENSSSMTPGKLAHAVLDVLDGFNTIGENVVRLSAYKVALDNGMSRPEAARLARELTVDFNRKGRAGRELGPLYAFFNAGVQGTARMATTLADPKRAAAIVGGGLALGSLQAMVLLAAGYDDDEPSEWVRANGFIVPTGKDKDGKKTFAIIPYPHGFKFIPNTGRILTELALNGGKNAVKKTGEAIGSIASTFNPFGGGNVFTLDGLLKTIAPTVIDPFIEWGFNKNFAGNNIEKQGYGGETDNRPGVARTKESTMRTTTGQAYMGISKVLNWVSGGTDYEAGKVSPTPEVVRYIAQTVGGGVLREVEKAINASTASIRGEKVGSSQIPLLGRFAGEVDDDQVQKSRYYNAGRRIQALGGTVKRMDDADKTDLANAFEKAHPEATLYEDLHKAQAAISELNKQAVQTVGNAKEIAEIDNDRLEKMRELNEAVAELEKETGKPTLAAKIKGWRKETVTP